MSDGGCGYRVALMGADGATALHRMPLSTTES